MLPPGPAARGCLHDAGKQLSVSSLAFDFSIACMHYVAVCLLVGFLAFWLVGLLACFFACMSGLSWLGWVDWVWLGLDWLAVCVCVFACLFACLLVLDLQTLTSEDKTCYILNPRQLPRRKAEGVAKQAEN